MEEGQLTYLSKMENGVGPGVPNSPGWSVKLVRKALGRLWISSSASCVSSIVPVSKGEGSLWIVGPGSVRNSNVRDNAHSDQHAHAMQLLRKS